MMTFLAQSANQAAGATSAITQLFTRLDTLAHPEEAVKQLQQLPAVLAAIFVAAGLVCMLQGFRLYKGVVVMVALITGVVAGYRLGQIVQAEIIVAGCLGVLLAVLAWPLMKYAVAVAGGLAGAFVGANAWSGVAAEMAKYHVTVNDAPWIGALVGLMALGLLSFILFEVSVMLFTSLSGSVLAVMGIIALLLNVPAFQQGITDNLTNKPIVLPLLVIVPGIIGLIIQQQIIAHKKGGKKPPVAFVAGGAKA